MLLAATYPLQMVEAERVIPARPKQKGNGLTHALTGAALRPGTLERGVRL